MQEPNEVQPAHRSYYIKRALTVIIIFKLVIAGNRNLSNFRYEMKPEFIADVIISIIARERFPRVFRNRVL